MQTKEEQGEEDGIKIDEEEECVNGVGGEWGGRYWGGGEWEGVEF